MVKARTTLAKTTWQERAGGFFLLIFLLVALVGPASGWLAPPNEINLDQVYQPPFTAKTGAAQTTVCWLGTDHLGRDVLANLVYGARTALLISLPAMLLATVIGLLLGSAAGFWGDTGLQVTGVSVVIGVLVLGLGYHYAVYLRQMAWAQAFASGSGRVLLEAGKSGAIFLLLAGVGWQLNGWVPAIGWNKPMALPVDQLVLKLIEVVSAVPRLLLILCLAAFAPPALLNIILLAALTYWTSIARLVRGELRQVRELSFIQAARVSGLSDQRILWRHALPNALPPVIVAFAFGLGNLMQLEATLSFLGIGLPTDVPSWGRLLRDLSGNFAAWWLLLFPALLLCATILSLQTLAQWSLKILNPARK